MRFDREEVRRIANLARLELTDSELADFAGHLGSVLDHAAALEEPGEGGSDEPPGPEVELRRDSPGDDALSLPPADFAPGWVEGFFTVPRLKAFEAAPERDRADS